MPYILSVHRSGSNKFYTKKFTSADAALMRAEKLIGDSTFIRPVTAFSIRVIHVMPLYKGSKTLYEKQVLRLWFASKN